MTLLEELTSKVEAYMAGDYAVTKKTSVPLPEDVPLDAEVELLRETRRLVFLRGMVLQGDNRVAAFSATIRKATAQ